MGRGGREGSACGGRPYALVWTPIPVISWLMPFIGHLGVCASSGLTYDFAGPYTVNEDDLLFGRPVRYITLNPRAARKCAGATGAAAGDGAGGPSPCCNGGGSDGGGKGSARGCCDVEEGGSKRRCCETGSGDTGDGASGKGGSACCGAAGCGQERWVAASAKGGAVAGPSGRGGGGGCCGCSCQPPEAEVPEELQRCWDQRLAFAAAMYRMMPYNLLTTNCHCFVAHFLNQIGYRGGGWNTVQLAALMCVSGRHVSLFGLLYTWLPWLALVTLGPYFGRLIFLWVYLGLCAPLTAWFFFYNYCLWRDLSFT
ncbi:hypothetical protein HYH02_010854 [Chlamydomonas schloesseri]|uniref:Uncharacterized protein n=1 Tax=Chlamydomonas schloesseri TaxID=2026947 RepID=A0A835T3Y1_9CHLO|nr:hypothetical protein HYH02_010854 [Chlamydomonas schloesseri]|eukprot:KAG2438399.1 hypothetical protein HYH02_010854 [Chlamydomonas schloesseri]